MPGNVIWVGELSREEPAFDLEPFGRGLGRGLASSYMYKMTELEPQVAKVSWKIYSSLEPEKRKVLEQTPGFKNWLRLWQKYGIAPQGLEKPQVPEDLEQALTRARIKQMTEELRLREKELQQMEPLRRAQAEYYLSRPRIEEKRLELEKPLTEAKVRYYESQPLLLKAETELRKAQAEFTRQKPLLELMRQKPADTSVAWNRFQTRYKQANDLYTMIFDPTRADPAYRPILATNWLSTSLSVVKSALNDEFLSETGVANEALTDVLTKALQPDIVPYLIQNPAGRVRLEDLVNIYIGTAGDEAEAKNRALTLKQMEEALPPDWVFVYDKKRKRLKLVKMERKESPVTFGTLLRRIFRRGE